MYNFFKNKYLYPNLNEKDYLKLWNLYKKEINKNISILEKIKKSKLDINYLDILGITEIKKWKYLKPFFISDTSSLIILLIIILRIKIS